MNQPNGGQSRGSANPRMSNTSQNNLALNASAARNLGPQNMAQDLIEPSAQQYSALLRENEMNRRKIEQLEQEKRTLDSQLFAHQQRQAEVNQQHEKELEDWSDRTNSKEMKEILEDEIDKIKAQRTASLEQHQQELKAMRDRQGSIMDDLTEQKRKYDHLHFYLERNTKQFEFEEEQLKSELKIKSQEVLNLEKQLRLAGPQSMSRDQVSNLVSENESLRQRMSEMAKKLSSYSDLERKLNENQSYKLEAETQALEQRLRLEQEKFIRQRTVEIEQEVTRLNQELAFAKNNAIILQSENDQLKDQARKMSLTVAEGVEEIRLWKEKEKNQSVAASSNNLDSMALRNELRNKDNLVKEQEEQIYRLASDLANYKREYERSVNRPSVSEQDRNQMERMRQENENLNAQLQDLIGDLDNQKKKSSKPQQQQQNAEAELRERNQLLEAKHRQLTSTIVELESRLARHGEGPSKLGQSVAVNNSQRNTVVVESSNYQNQIIPSQFAQNSLNPAQGSMQYNYYPNDNTGYNSPPSQQQLQQQQQQRNSFHQNYQVGGQLTNSQIGVARNMNIYESGTAGQYRY